MRERLVQQRVDVVVHLLLLVIGLSVQWLRCLVLLLRRVQVSFLERVLNLAATAGCRQSGPLVALAKDAVS